MYNNRQSACVVATDSSCVFGLLSQKVLCDSSKPQIKKWPESSYRVAYTPTDLKMKNDTRGTDAELLPGPKN